MHLSEKIDPTHTALLVIDIQKDFASPEGLRATRGGDLSQVESMIDRLEFFIAAAKRVGVPVYYTQQQYDREKLNDLQKEQYDLDGKIIMCNLATGGHQFYRITPPPEDVFVKYNYNAFSNPALQERLVVANIKTLIITGMDTPYCVETAVRNGFDLGYKIVVPRDVVASNGKYPELQQRTLDLIKKVFGVVVDSREIVELWETTSISKK